ncbi:MAG: class F sortase [Dehalococcoidia bacterium]|jgi:LPXTG-site transpeptidase (sortase) family protein
MRKAFWLLLIPGMVLTAFSSFSCSVFPMIISVDQVCSPTPGMVDATFHWLPGSLKGDQYLDVSWFSTFPAGQFASEGPIDSNANAATFPGLQVNMVTHWRVNTLFNGQWFVSAAGSFTTAACGYGDGSATPTGMNLIIPKIGVNAPINDRVIGTDGAMGIPNGKDDVVWYDFQNYGGMGGFPGISGFGGANAVFSGHVDYHPHYTAVFWYLSELVQGDEIDVQLLDGSYVRYAVAWTQWIGDTDAFTQYALKDGSEELTIITCGGTFDPSTRNYDHRFVVRATRIG